MNYNIVCSLVPVFDYYKLKKKKKNSVQVPGDFAGFVAALWTFILSPLAMSCVCNLWPMRFCDLARTHHELWSCAPSKEGAKSEECKWVCKDDEDAKTAILR